MSERPAKFLGLYGRKGTLAEGADADIVVFDPEAEFHITADIIQHKHKLTPHDHKQLVGVVQRTYLRGTKVYDGGTFLAGPMGKPILRKGESR